MNKDIFVGILGVTVGLIGVGYAMGSHSKMAELSKKLDTSIDELANNTVVDIPDEMIERAVEKAVTREVKQAVSKATDVAVAAVKRDMHKQVSDAVESEYSDIKETVLEELTTAAAKIDAKRVRADVERAAKEHAIKKFDDNLDDILEGHKREIENVTRIYKTIADAMAPNQNHNTNERNVVLRLG